MVLTPGELEVTLSVLKYSFIPIVAVLALVSERRHWLSRFSLLFAIQSWLLIAVWLATRGITNPVLGDVGVGMFLDSVLWIALASFLSTLSGSLCLRSVPLVLIWLAPEVIILGVTVIILLNAYV
jgi:hypothetical protein